MVGSQIVQHTMSMVTGFPFLTDEEFINGCEQLQVLSDYKLSIGVIPVLRLTRTVPLCEIQRTTTNSAQPDLPLKEGEEEEEEEEGEEEEEKEEEEDDDEAREEDVITDDEERETVMRKDIGARMTSSGQPPSLLVIYDVILSPSYRVPVVYIHPRKLAGYSLPSINQLRESIVPASNRSAIEGNGVCGALSMTVCLASNKSICGSVR